MKTNKKATTILSLIATIVVIVFSCLIFGGLENLKDLCSLDVHEEVFAVGDGINSSDQLNSTVCVEISGTTFKGSSEGTVILNVQENQMVTIENCNFEQGKVVVQNGDLAVKNSTFAGVVVEASGQNSDNEIKFDNCLIDGKGNGSKGSLGTIKSGFGSVYFGDNTTCENYGESTFDVVFDAETDVNVFKWYTANCHVGTNAPSEKVLMSNNSFIDFANTVKPLEACAGWFWDQGTYCEVIENNVVPPKESFPGEYVLDAFTEESSDNSNFEFVLNDGGNGYSVAVSESSTATNLVVPANYDGCPVVGVQVSGFKNNSSLQKIILGSYLSKIETDAFYGCTNLEYCNMESSIVNISTHAFYSTKIAQGQTLELPRNLVWLGSYAFQLCHMTGVKIPKSVTSISTAPFINCSNLVTIDVEDGNVGYYADEFSDGTNTISNVIVKNSATEVKLVQTCNGTIDESGVCKIPEGVNVIGVYSFYYQSRMKKVNMPNSLKEIQVYAFQACTKLEEINIPQHVTKIETACFDLCYGLIKIDFEATACDNLVASNSVFSKAGVNGGGIEVTFSENVTKIPDYLFYPQDYSQNVSPNIKSVSFGENVQEIGQYAFANCARISTLSIPASVENIQKGAFFRCSGISTLTFEENSILETIGRSAFNYCQSLTEVNIPDSVTTLVELAFYRCSGLEKVTIGAGVGTIGENAFSCDVSGYPNVIENIIVKSSSLEISKTMFGGCANLKALATNSNIASSGFAGITTLKDLTIGESVSSIGTSAFSGCTGIDKILYNSNNLTDFEQNNYVFANAGKDRAGIDVTVGESVTKIPDYLFSPITYSDASQNPKLKSVSLDNSSVTSIGACSFSNSSITEITIPHTVTDIKFCAFYYCKQLGKVTIVNDPSNGKSSSLTSIGQSVFHTCTSLTSFEIPDSNKTFTIGPWGFYNCTALTDFVVGSQTTKIWYYEDGGYYGSFNGCWNLQTLTIKSTNLIKYTSYDLNGIGIDLSGAMFGGCAKLKTLTTNSNIASSGFAGITSLESLTIGVSVSSIGSSAFSGCTGMTNINFNAVNCAGFSYPDTVERNDVFTNAGKDGIGISVVIGGDVTYVPSCLFYPQEFNQNVSPKITSLSLGSKIQTIDGYAFANLSELESVVLPEGITTIAYCAFYRCSGLGEIVIPDSVTTVGSYVFAGCYGLEKLTVGSGVTEIHFDPGYNGGTYSVFSACANISELTVNTTALTISASMFGGCANLKTLVTNSNVASASKSGESFWGCSTLTSLTTLSGCSSIGADAFRSTGLVNISLAEGLGTIGHYAFCQVPATSVTIPASVTYIGYAPFVTCPNLTSLEIASENVTFESRGNNLIYNTKQKRLVDTCEATDISNLPSDIITYGAYCLYNRRMTHITLSNVTKNIEYQAFGMCSNLKTLVIPDSVTTIDDYAFYYLSSLETLTVGSGVTSILYNESDAQYRPFMGCSKIQSLTIKGQISGGIKKEMFGGCANLKTLDTNSNIASSGFAGLTALEDLTINSGVTEIGESAFANCTGIIELNFRASVVGDLSTTIFGGCTNIKTLLVNAPSLTDASQADFGGCASLENLTLYCGSINMLGFASLSALETVRIGTEVIYLNAFKECNALVQVIFESGVKTIEKGAFDHCDSLMKVYIPASVTRICAPSGAYRCPFFRAGGYNSTTQLANCHLFFEVSKATSETSSYNYEDGWGDGWFSDEGIYANIHWGATTEQFDNHVSSGGSGTSTSLFAYEDCSGGVRITAYNGASASVAIPDKIDGKDVVEIDADVFRQNMMITEIDFSANTKISSIDNVAFYNCYKLQSVRLSSRITTIGSYAFSYCESLSSINLDSVTTIGSGAFRGCESLSVITLASVTRIESTAFANCTGLNYVYLKTSGTTIGGGNFGVNAIFDGCSENMVIFTDCSFSSEVSTRPFVWMYYVANQYYRYYFGSTNDSVMGYGNYYTEEPTLSRIDTFRNSNGGFVVWYCTADQFKSVVGIT